MRQDGGNYGVTLPLVLGNDPSGAVAAVGTEAAGVEDRRPLGKVILDPTMGS